MNYGKLNPLGKLNFPGFQEILDFTATGSEASTSVPVDGDTDKEYKIFIYNKGVTNNSICIRLNGDNGSNYGYQLLDNSSGTISSSRATAAVFIPFTGASDNFMAECSLLTPSGFIKTFFSEQLKWTSGTTIGFYRSSGQVWNSTANVKNIAFITYYGGSMVAGTRITVYARRSN